jgi:hypothetical protein
MILAQVFFGLAEAGFGTAEASLGLCNFLGTVARPRSRESELGCVELPLHLH